MAGGDSENIIVYLISMGDTEVKVRDFAGKFSYRFKMEPNKVLGLSRRLPVKLGSFDLEKAKKVGMEIKRMGGDVKLTKVVTKKSPPPPPKEDVSWIDRESLAPDDSSAPPPVVDRSWIINDREEPDFTAGDSSPVSPPSEGGNSWLTHGSTESQEDLKELAYSEPGDEEYPSQYEYPEASTGDAPEYELPEERRVAGKYDVKHTYTTEEAYGIGKDKFEKVKELYADRRGRSSVLSSPLAKFIYLVVFAVLLYYGYTERQYLFDIFMGAEKWSLSDAYAHRINPGVSIPPDLTGLYKGELKYTTRSGDTALVDVNLYIEGRDVKNVVVNVLSTSSEVGKYEINIDYAPKYLEYERKVEGTITYSYVDTFDSPSNSIGIIDDKGVFRIALIPMNVGLDPADIPDTEKDRLGNVVFLNIEGAYGDKNVFYGGLKTSTTEILGWEARKR